MRHFQRTIGQFSPQRSRFYFTSEKFHRVEIRSVRSVIPSPPPLRWCWVLTPLCVRVRPPWRRSPAPRDAIGRRAAAAEAREVSATQARRGTTRSRSRGEALHFVCTWAERATGRGPPRRPASRRLPPPPPRRSSANRRPLPSASL